MSSGPRARGRRRREPPERRRVPRPKLNAQGRGGEVRRPLGWRQKTRKPRRRGGALRSAGALRRRLAASRGRGAQSRAAEAVAGGRPTPPRAPRGPCGVVRGRGAALLSLWSGPAGPALGAGKHGARRRRRAPACTRRARCRASPSCSCNNNNIINNSNNNNNNNHNNTNNDK